MPMSAAERSKKYRERIKNNPVRLQEYKTKKHNDYMERRRLISNQTEREQRKTRRGWRMNQQNRRKGNKDMQKVLLNTPPGSPEPSVSNVKTESIRRKYQRRIVTYKEENEKLKVKLKTARRSNLRLQKQILQAGPNTPRKCATALMRQPRDRLRKTLIYHSALIEELREKQKMYKYNRAKENVIAGNILRKYKLLKQARTHFGLKKNKPKVYKSRYSDPDMVQRVRRFYLQDIVSTPAAGKKECITRRKVKKQKRYLTDTMKNLHTKFCTENSALISYAAFAKLRPFWVVKRTSRDTCACTYCSNFTFQLQALCNKAELQKNEMEVMKEVTCDINSPECMHRECETCRDKTLSYTGDVDENMEISWPKWVTEKERRVKKDYSGKETVFNVRVTKKELQHGTVHDLKETFQNSLDKHCTHKYKIHHHYEEMMKMKEHLKDRECALVVDFSENYNCKYGTEIQSFHFGASRHQVSLHTGVLYTSTKTQSFCSLSADTRHGPSAIWAHLDPMLNSIKGDFDTVSFISDSPSNQYRCARNFNMLHDLIHREYGFEGATWNFSEAGHGKSAADGVGAVIKRTADSLINCGRDLPNAQSL